MTKTFISCWLQSVLRTSATVSLLLSLWDIVWESTNPSCWTSKPIKRRRVIKIVMTGMRLANAYWDASRLNLRNLAWPLQLNVGDWIARSRRGIKFSQAAVTGNQQEAVSMRDFYKLKPKCDLPSKIPLMNCHRSTPDELPPLISQCKCFFSLSPPRSLMQTLTYDLTNICLAL